MITIDQIRHEVVAVRKQFCVSCPAEYQQKPSAHWNADHSEANQLWYLWYDAYDAFAELELTLTELSAALNQPAEERDNSSSESVSIVFSPQNAAVLRLLQRSAPKTVANVQS